MGQNPALIFQRLVSKAAFLTVRPRGGLVRRVEVETGFAFLAYSDTVAVSSKVRAERAGGCRDRLGTAHLYGYRYSRITR